jgi:hypothetical protein
MKADHFMNMESGHLKISNLWIIMQDAPWQQLHLTCWQPAQRRKAVLASLSVDIVQRCNAGIASLPVGIMLVPVYTKYQRGRCRME